jgi:hypothetical protein
MAGQGLFLGHGSLADIPAMIVDARESVAEVLLADGIQGT